MKFIELFAGIGGFRLGLERTGHECVWANEWLERPRRIYERNFGEQPDGRDIRALMRPVSEFTNLSMAENAGFNVETITTMWAMYNFRCWLFVK